MAIIRGIDVVLYNKAKAGKDEFNRDIFTDVPEVVHNVLVTPSGTQEILDTVNLTGKKAIYTLAIPKGDAHNWNNVKVEFFGKVYRTIGEPQRGIDELIPLDWNAKIQVELYEQ